MAQDNYEQYEALTFREQLELLPANLQNALGHVKYATTQKALVELTYKTQSIIALTRLFNAGYIANINTYTAFHDDSNLWYNNLTKSINIIVVSQDELETCSDTYSFIYDAKVSIPNLAIMSTQKFIAYIIGQVADQLPS